MVNCTSSPGRSGVDGLMSSAVLDEAVKFAGTTMVKAVGSAVPDWFGSSVRTTLPAIVTGDWTETLWPLIGAMPNAVKAAMSNTFPGKVHAAVALGPTPIAVTSSRPRPLTPPFRFSVTLKPGRIA